MRLRRDGDGRCLNNAGRRSDRSRPTSHALLPDPPLFISPVALPRTGLYTALAEHHVCSRRPAAALACKKAVFRLYNGAVAALAAQGDSSGSGAGSHGGGLAAPGAAAAWDEANLLLHRCVRAFLRPSSFLGFMCVWVSSPCLLSVAFTPPSLRPGC